MSNVKFASWFSGALNANDSYYVNKHLHVEENTPYYVTSTCILKKINNTCVLRELPLNFFVILRKKREEIKEEKSSGNGCH